ncbi:DUF3920 family protein [Niallia endozanthoxylica]|uniref:DUF3920 family protein n=1 Tax=Niallia endozanthoxylica TaxID=2036016 RepID=A0A5J5H439_9BACI|nr:DUF3920 family protein [Niallia endozanthoxylica]KAA9014204.1 DUF3920 family protein [Niallia endozanthoxylica]
MTLTEVLQKRTILQQYKCWYVLDNDFPWNIPSIYHKIHDHLDTTFPIPVIFCSIREANKIISDLGHDEDEYLRFAAGIYWRELGIIFIFHYEEYETLIETLFHEYRHVMQDLDADFRHHFEHDKKLPYKERKTEMDAFQFAKEKTNIYFKTLYGRENVV